jgi:ubiquinone biosynthesis protein Coq4
LPGSPGSVDPLLAQHDFVHCVADYGTSATGEIEVFSFIAAAIPDASGFSYLVVILGLFETGNVAMVPGVATASPGHLQLPGGTERMGDAIRRGLLLGRDVMGDVDWFEYADDPLDDVRSKLGIVPKSAEAIAAGSLSANDPNAVFGKSN